MNKNLKKDGVWLERTLLLLGEEAAARLAAAWTLVVGLGGVGACAAEMLCRAGVGRMTIIDGDAVEETNLNRQLPALRPNLGRPKVEVVAERLRQINPDAEIEPVNEFLRDDRMREILRHPYDYVIDAIDTLSPKVYLIAISLENGLRVVSSMGAGGKVDPSLVGVADLADSQQCALARALRKRLHRMGIRSGVKVVFSTEPIDRTKVVTLDEGEENHKSIVGTVSYMPIVFGCHCASVVIRDLAGVSAVSRGVVGESLDPFIGKWSENEEQSVNDAVKEFENIEEDI